VLAHAGRAFVGVKWHRFQVRLLVQPPLTNGDANGLLLLLLEARRLVGEQWLI